MSFIVITDTSANLPTELLKERQIPVIPVHYLIDGKAYTCTDTDSFDAEEFYGRMRNGLKVTTTQVTPQDYIDFCEPYLQQGQDVVLLCMASGISGSYNSACIAADQLMEQYPDRRVRAVDTKSASLGTGFIALHAADMRDQGMDVDEAVPLLENYVLRTFSVFTVDDLMFLRRGGRLSNLSAIVGTVLHIKPLLKGSENAQIVAFAKVRGRKRSIEALAERYDKLVIDPEKQLVGIAQASCREDAAYLESLLRKNHPPKQILNVEYEPVTGCHVGPGALALFFMSHEEVRKET